MNEDQQRFEEIINNIDELVEEAINIIPENMVAKAKSYWYAHILCAINDDHEFLGGSIHHMQDCLDEWIEQEDEDTVWCCETGREAHMRDEDID
tara:strand:+ start:326 stop:607 length:282 start_codon:yes stop_codon:yes gene_type:complete